MFDAWIGPLSLESCDADELKIGAEAQPFEREVLRVRHRASVKRDDLVVRLIGVDKARCREVVGDLDDAGGIDALARHPRAVLAEILAGCGDDQRSLAEQRQRVGDVAGHAATHPAHRVNQEADGEHVNFVRQDVIFEVAGEVHNVIVG